MGFANKIKLFAPFISEIELPKKQAWTISKIVFVFKLYFKL